MGALHRNTIRAVYRNLIQAYGAQGWWPADTRFEILVGAVLTQNAAWTNVEYALDNLRRNDVLDAEAMVSLEHERLGELIRPSGYFNVKAKRLKALCQHVIDAGGLDALAAKDTPALRRDLLSVNGVGRETADDIVLYAFHRPVFVIDAYTRRIFARLGKIDGNEGYEDLRRSFERALGPDVDTFQEYHGLLVNHAKEACSARPKCDRCVLRRSCPIGREEREPHS